MVLIEPPIHYTITHRFDERYREWRYVAECIVHGQELTVSRVKKADAIRAMGVAIDTITKDHYRLKAKKRIIRHERRTLIVYLTVLFAAMTLIAAVGYIIHF